MAEPVSEDTFDPHELMRRKAAARAADEEELISGRVTAEELRKRNFAFGHLDIRAGRLIINGNLRRLR